MIIGLIAVIVSLGFGLVSFFKGGQFNTRYSNEAMRWRVLLQAIALGIFFLILWFRH